MAVPENAYSLHIAHHAAINALLSLLLPRWGVSPPIVRNPGCRIASLACPGLCACNPFGVFVERLKSTTRAGLWASPPFGVFVERLFTLQQTISQLFRI